jgi:hypothetical protein
MGGPTEPRRLNKEWNWINKQSDEAPYQENHLFYFIFLTQRYYLTVEFDSRNHIAIRWQPSCNVTTST